MHSNNVNVSQSSIDPNYNNNVNDNVDKYDTARKVEMIADKLLQRFNLPKESRGFMCKVAYKLPEARIWEHYEHVTTVKNGKPITNPIGLFIWLCKRDGV